MKAVVAAIMAVTATAAVAQGAANDPYIWLEDVYSPKALAWVEAENARTLNIFEKDADYAALYADALKIGEATDRIPTPSLIGGQVMNFWQDAAHVRGIWRTTSIADYRNAAPAWRTVIDLDALSAAEKANWVWKGADCEPVAERRCILSLSDGGEDATTRREFDMATGKFVEGGFVLPKSKQSSAWESANSLLVARDWGAGSMTASGYPFILKRVARGKPLAQAVEIFRGKPDDISVRAASFVDGGGKRITLIERGITFFESEAYLVTPKGTAKLDLPAKIQLVGMVDGQLIFVSNQDWSAGGVSVASGSLASIDAAAAAKGVLKAQVIFAPGPRQSIDGDDVSVSGTRVVAGVYDNVRGKVMSFAHGKSGWTATSLALADNASVGIGATERTSDRVFLSSQSFLQPSTLWMADAGTGGLDKIKQSPARFDAAGLVSEQFEAVSKDGTKIPYFVVHRKDAKLDGSTPTIMDAYGGFQVSSTPYYSGIIGKLWMERGGAFVLANIRGGGEFGPAWHEAGLKTKRQIIYDDFAAVGEDLIRRKLTSVRRLGITGGSNGGLLMGVEMIQRPDLWAAVNINVPLLDMIRFEQIAAGASWVGEYGSVANPDERAFWERTSPYSALRKDGKYPEPYIFTTTKDDRVGPVHARKFAARMKEYGLPYYYYENTEGGHGSGANLKQTARTNALEMVYFTRKLMDR